MAVLLEPEPDEPPVDPPDEPVPDVPDEPLEPDDPPLDPPEEDEPPDEPEVPLDPLDPLAPPDEEPPDEEPPEAPEPEVPLEPDEPDEPAPEVPLEPEEPPAAPAPPAPEVPLEPDVPPDLLLLALERFFAFFLLALRSEPLSEAEALEPPPAPFAELSLLPPLAELEPPPAPLPVVPEPLACASWSIPATLPIVTPLVASAAAKPAIDNREMKSANDTFFIEPPVLIGNYLLKTPACGCYEYPAHMRLVIPLSVSSTCSIIEMVERIRCLEMDYGMHRRWPSSHNLRRSMPLGTCWPAAHPGGQAAGMGATMQSSCHALAAGRMRPIPRLLPHKALFRAQAGGFVLN